MKPSQANTLTYGFDPGAWLVYADWLMDQGQDAKVDLWRTRGEVGLTLMAWLELTALWPPVIQLPIRCELRPRWTKKMLFLPLWIVRAISTAGPVFLILRASATPNESTSWKRFMRSKVFAIADAVLASAVIE